MSIDVSLCALTQGNMADKALILLTLPLLRAPQVFSVTFLLLYLNMHQASYSFSDIVRNTAVTVSTPFTANLLESIIKFPTILGGCVT